MPWVDTTVVQRDAMFATGRKTPMFKNLGQTILTTFIVVALARSPEVAGDFVETIGELLAVLIEQFQEILNALF